MRLLLLALLFSTIARAQGTVYVPWGKTLLKGGHELMFTGRAWDSAVPHDEEGKKREFDDGEGFSYWEGEATGRWGATQDLQLGLSASFRQVRADVATAEGTETLSASGIQSIGLNVLYSFKPVNRTHYAAEGFYRFNPYTNEDLDPADPTANLALGNDGGDFGVNALITWAHPRQNFISARLGYRRPGKDQSGEVGWQGEAAMVWKNLALVLGLEGVYSLEQDAYTDDPENKPQVNTGGTQLFRSINREYLAPYAGFNFAWGKGWRVEARYQAVLDATSYDTGSLLSLSLVRRMEGQAQVRLVDQSFKEYDVEAAVTKVSPKKQFVIIDKGLSTGVYKGQRFDFFFFDYLGGNVLLGRGVVIQVNADQAVVQLVSRFPSKHEIKEGTVARGMVK